jgi:hypothetical protein
LRLRALWETTPVEVRVLSGDGRGGGTRVLLPPVLLPPVQAFIGFVALALWNRAAGGAVAVASG